MIDKNDINFFIYLLLLLIFLIFLIICEILNLIKIINSSYGYHWYCAYLKFRHKESQSFSSAVWKVIGRLAFSSLKLIPAEFYCDYLSRSSCYVAEVMWTMIVWFRIWCLLGTEVCCLQQIMTTHWHYSMSSMPIMGFKLINYKIGLPRHARCSVLPDQTFFKFLVKNVTLKIAQILAKLLKN